MLKGQYTGGAPLPNLNFSSIFLHPVLGQTAKFKFLQYLHPVWDQTTKLKDYSKIPVIRYFQIVHDVIVLALEGTLWNVKYEIIVVE